MYTSGTCTAGFKTFYPGSRLVFTLFLGESASLGGTLTFTTCGLTRNNTVLYVGTGCATGSVSFGCLAGNDDATQCAANRLASTAYVTVTQRTYFVQLGGINGGAITSGLQWTYAPPLATRTRTAAATRSRSGSATRSRTRKRK
jgi:hypothetical protein